MDHPFLPTDAPLGRAVVEALRDRVLRGHLAAGEKLPSTRALARDLGVSRNTVLLAYEVLKAEGYLVARGGSGHYVSDDLPLPPSPALEDSLGERDPGETGHRLSHWGRRAMDHGSTRIYSREQMAGPPIRHDFLFGLSLTEAFPHSAWTKAVRAVLDARRRDPSRLRYQPAEGHPNLRRAVAPWLRDHRGIATRGRDILITNGSQQGIELTLRLLVNPGERVAVEDPGYGGFREVLAALGAEAVPLPVDGDGPRIDLLAGMDPPVRGVCVTPSHQFPTGVVLSLARRMALLQWARESDAWILEDDYDSEFRYGDRPLPALAAADLDGRVVYLAGFSKALFPSLRLGFVSAPSALFPAFVRAREVVDRHGPGLEQEALARWMEDGSFARHLRRVRTLQAQRRATLVAALEREFGASVRITGAQAGIHLVAWFPGLEQADMEAWSARALDRGVRALPMGGHIAPPRSHPPAFVLGYAGIAREDIDGGVRLLRETAP